MKPSTDKIAAAISVQRLAESRGVKLTRKGTTLTGTCPFHAGKNPTLEINTKANTWACTGKCRVGTGTAIEWVMKAEGVSGRHALELLRQDFGTGSSKGKPSKAKKASTNKLDAFTGTDEPDHVLMDRVLGYYSDTLKQSPEALAYLRDRKLINGELIERFRLGYSNRTLGYRMPASNRKHGFALRGQLERLGINRSSGHEHFWGSVVFPVLDEHGAVSQIYGRKILDKRLRKGTPLHLWLPGGPRGIFNAQAFTASSEIVICKGVIDALTLWSAGVRNVTATFHGFDLHEDLRHALEVHAIKKVLIAFDRTKAGDAAPDTLAAEFGSKGIEVFRVLWPAGMDANDYARSMDNASDALQQAVRSPVWLAGKTRSPIVEEAIAETRGLETAAFTTPSPDPSPEVEQREDEVVLHLGDRRWRVRGLRRNMSFEVLKVNLLVSRDNGVPMSQGFHVDTLELYSARQRAAFIKQAADELGLDENVIKNDLGRVLLELERLQDQQIREALEPQPKAVELSEEEREQALRLLRDPHLLDRVVEDLERCGLVGEAINKAVAYLAVTSRKLEEPLAVVVQSSSASGKTSLMDAVLAFVPEEDRVSFSAMTGQSLFYMGEHDLAHRVLAIAEEAGARKSSYALKLLQSEGEISIASTAKDSGTGRLITQEYRVQGPVMLFLTTTSLHIDPELANRCVVLAVDEGREQTAAIHAVQRQRQTLEGLLARQDNDALIRLHRNAQRLLRPIRIVNPFAGELLFFDGQARSRRDHSKYLTLIKTVTLVHQYQRPTKMVEHAGHKLQYIEVTQADIEVANKLAAHVLMKANDELPPQTTALLETIGEYVKARASKEEVKTAEVRFTRRQLREHVGLSNSSVRVHLDRLVDLEYLIQERGGRKLSLYRYDADLAGFPAHLAGTWRAPGGPHPRQVVQNDSADLSSPGGVSAPARLGKRRANASYSQAAK